MRHACAVALAVLAAPGTAAGFGSTASSTSRTGPSFASGRLGPSTLLHLELEAAAAVAQAAAEAASFLEEHRLASAPEVRATRPSYPPRWIADVRITQVFGNVTTPTLSPFKGAGEELSRLVQESDNKRRAQYTAAKMPIAPAAWAGTPLEWMNSTQYTFTDFMGLEINGNRMALNLAKYSDLFFWTKLAKDGGEVTYEGRQLHRWFWSLDRPTPISCELLVDAGNLPVHLWQNVTTQGKRYEMGYEFVSFLPNATDPATWKGVTEDEFRHAVVCPTPADPKPQNVTMYIFHPENNFDIAGQDLADVIGDTVFVCLDVITNQTSWTDHRYAWLTKWEIEMWPVLGQYQNCNGYDPPSCFGSNNQFVGHEAAYYLGPQPVELRQCGSNPLMGEWFSLPVAGQCPEGVRPDGKTCSWRKAQRVKTIDGKCLFQGGVFRNTCSKEAKAPFAESQKQFLRAFASDDPSAGGCPPLAEEQETAAVIVV